MRNNSAATNSFDACATLAVIKADRAVRKHRMTWGKSRLSRHRAELAKLKSAGASFADLAHWLRREKRITVDRSTVMRFMAKLPEEVESANG